MALRKFLLGLLVLLSSFAQFESFGQTPMHKLIAKKAVTSGYLAVTTTYLNSDATLSALSTGVKDGIDRWFRDLNGYSNGSYTTYNVWSKIIAIYPIIGGTSGSTAVNAKNPGTYNLTHTGSPTIASTGISYNGSSQYSNTGFTPSNSNTTSDLVCYGAHRRDANNDANATIGIVSTGNTYWQILSTYLVTQLASNSVFSAAQTRTVASLWSTSMSSSTVNNMYYNGTNIKSNTGVTIGNCGNVSFYIGACHLSASTLYGGANTVDYVYLGNGTWSDAEQTFMYNAFAALQTILGR